MGFRDPHLFWLLIPFFLLLSLHFFARWRRRRDLLQLADPRIIGQLVFTEALQRRKWKERIGLTSVLLLVISIAGPQWGPDLKEVKQRGVDLFVAIDVSRSMLAEDVAPTRLDRAKQSLSYLLRKLEGNRVGIIAFARYAAIQCPLTVDVDAARMVLDSLDTNTIPAQGTAIGDALNLAASRFNKDERSGKAVVLLTDGEDHRSNPLEAAQSLKEKGVAVFTIGIGTSKGDVIKKRDENGKVTEFLKHDGEMVLSRMDDSLLSKIAAVTNGKYYRASSTDQEIDEIADILNGMDKKEFGQGLHQSYKDRYQWLGFLALLLLIIEFFIPETPGQIKRIDSWIRSHRIRFGKWGGVATLVLLLAVPSVFAGPKEHIREGNKLLKKGDLAGAKGAFESALIDDPESPLAIYNIGTTELLQGNLEEAQKRLEQAESISPQPLFKSQCQYNLGHIKFLQGDRAGAIEKFKDSLRLNPQDADAKYNIEYLLAGKTPPPPKQQPSPSPSQKDGSNKQDQNGADSKGKEDQKKSDADKEAQKKENAERVLQMIQDQEKENRKKAKPISFGDGKKEKPDENVEDW